MPYGYTAGGYYYPSAYQPAVYPSLQPQQQNVPYVPQPTVPPQAQQAQTQGKLPAISGVGWVDGMEAAKAQNIVYGSSYLFFDSKEPYFYIKTVGLDGVPQPLFICRYEQKTEQDLQHAEPPVQPEVDLSGYMTKQDFEEKISSFGRFVTEEDLEDRVLRVIQEKMSPTTKTAKRVPKEDA